VKPCSAGTAQPAGRVSGRARKCLNSDSVAGRNASVNVDGDGSAVSAGRTRTIASTKGMRSAPGESVIGSTGASTGVYIRSIASAIGSNSDSATPVAVWPGKWA